MKNRFYFLYIFFIIVSCNRNDEVAETAISGKLNLICADDVSPIINLQVEEFMRLYPDAKINQINTSSRNAIVQLLNDSVDVIATGRNFNREELEVIKKNNLKVDSSLVAFEGIVAISNLSNQTNKIHVDDIKNILNGKKFNWSQIKGSNLQSKITLAICDRNDGINEFLRNRFLNGEMINANILECSSTADVISNVQKFENVIGFVGQNWLTTKQYNVKMLDIADPNFYRDTVKKELEYFSPHQAHIYRNYYPLTRKIFILHNNIRYGAGVGFTTHVATTMGQQLFVKKGLVPATIPVRLIQLSNEEK